MPLEIKTFCPSGRQCEEVKDNTIHRCSLFIKVVGIDPQDSTKTIDQFGCAMSWLPLLLIEVAQTNRGQTEAITSMRNEMIARQDFLNGAIMTGIQNRKKELETK